MVFAKPHFLLFCDASVSKNAASDTDPVGGRWHFVLERIDAAERLEAADGERAQPRERLSLLAVVRGLEAIEQPSQVTLVTTSRYVARGLRYGLSEWRETGYIWEHFGVQKPIRNADLWQRIDGAMRFHEVACRLLESSLAQQSAVAALGVDEVAESLVTQPALNAEPEVTQPWIPAPHFPVRLPGRQTPSRRSTRQQEVDIAEESGALATLAAEPDQVAAAHAAEFAPARRAASVRHVPRPHLAARDDSWWHLASGWLGWWQGRGPARSRRFGGRLTGSLTS
ncbi:MAG: hypothetical protein IT423_04225 [Pirellulaceae bacterium]|nr:hypothetical protein [Pirellulaceae bacterium]